MPVPPTFADFAHFVQGFFKAPRVVFERHTTADDVDGWDSLAHARLILAVEEKYGVTLPADRLFDLDDVGMLYDLLAQTIAGATT